MNIKAMIKENNRLREQMTPANKDYYEDIVVYFRDSGAARIPSEQLLLDLAHQLLEAQSKGKSAKQLFGPDAEEYSRIKLQDLPKRKATEGIKYYVMIPWIALTLFFFIETLIGFFAQLLGQSTDNLTQISVLTLIIVAGGSILLVESVTKLLNHGTEEENAAPSKPKLTLKGIGIYVVILLIVVFVGFTFSSTLPTFNVQPGISLVITIIGALGWGFLFRSK
ncbi:DUF1129 family protein [Paenibacillus sp. IHBB 10380]|uniref:DUF1129 family protein n=1 Tax=Paenibacillus sp. IHBB 10380 TaxID=1566358 RepID=UPI0005CFAFA9|nr:DUF1129 family protein [Paenibacillus sp. IHBB 10380]AJS57180.1 hypothetical protein UB51_00180 [Paenibacillus sp. IHBB 10380]